MAAIGYPLTVHGTGGQTRAFIHIQDCVRCVELALSDAPKAGERVKIFNQMTETHRVRDLANLVAEITGATVNLVSLPVLLPISTVTVVPVCAVLSIDFTTPVVAAMT